MSGSMGLSAASPHSFSSNNGLNNNVNTLTNNCHSSVSTLMDPLQQEVQQQQTSLTNPNSRFSLEIPQMSIHHNQLNNNPHHHINNNHLHQQYHQHQQQMQAFMGASSSPSSAKIDAQMKMMDSRQHIVNEVKAEVDMANASSSTNMVHQSLLANNLQRQEAIQLHRQQQSQQQQQQQSQQLQFQAQMNLVQQQQRLMHQQRSHIQQQQLQQHLRHQLAGPPSKPQFEPGVCSRRLMQYMFNQRSRPQDNNIHFWRKFVGEFFAHGAKKRWCVSQYGNHGKQPTGVFPQDVWHCEICGSRPSRGFETTVEVLPRLCKIKYDSGILDELLFVDISNEYRLSSGHMVLEYGKAVQESIFEHLRVVREGQLRIIFTAELKILLWEFCARGHEELLPRKQLVPQVTQLAAAAQKYQNTMNQNQTGASNISMQDLQSNCQLFVAAARQLTRTLEAPTVNDLGYTKRYVRCLQISEVVNSMKDLIDFSRENRTGPIESLHKFPRRGEMVHQQVVVPQILPLDHNIAVAQSASTITSAHNSTLSGGSVNLTHNVNSISAFPTIPHQNSPHSMMTQVQNNGQSLSLPPDAGNTSNGLGSNSTTSSSLTHRSHLSSLQNGYQSVTSGGDSSSPNAFVAHSSTQQKPSNGSVKQQKHESSMMAHHLQELLMSSQLKSGVNTSNIDVKAGLNNGFGNVAINGNGFQSSSNVNEGLGGNEGGGMGSSISDSDSGNIGGVTSSFSDGLMNQSYLSGNNGQNVMGFGSSLSGNNTDSLDQSLLQDPSQSFPYDFESNDIFSWNS